MTIYGIPNCDTVKKTQTWFNTADISFDFHNYKKDGITKEKLKSWIKQLGVDPILNKKSATWRALSPEEQQAITTPTAAINLMMKSPSIIKRPIIEEGEKVIMVGFDADKYKEIFQK